MVRAQCIVGPNGKPCGDGPELGAAVRGYGSSILCSYSVVDFDYCRSRIDLEQAEANGPTVITYRIEGLTPGLHGFHM